MVFDETIMLFGIHLTIILLQIKISLAQQCTVSCTQVAVLRNMPYEEIREYAGAVLIDLNFYAVRVPRSWTPEWEAEIWLKINDLDKN